MICEIAPLFSHLSIGDYVLDLVVRRRRLNLEKYPQRVPKGVGLTRALAICGNPLGAFSTIVVASFETPLLPLLE